MLKQRLYIDPGGGYSRQFRIDVCRQGSQALILFKGRKSRIDALLKAQNQEMVPYLSNTSYKRPFKISLLSFITCIRACSTVLTDHIFLVLCVEVDTAIK